MSVFRKLPFDAVYHILSYDKRCVLKNGNVVNFVDKLDMDKYANVVELLLQKPKIQKNIRRANNQIHWDFYRVTFSNNHVLEYHINYAGYINDIVLVNATGRDYNRKSTRILSALSIV